MPKWLGDEGVRIHFVVFGLSMENREREKSIAIAGLQSRSARVDSAW